MHASKAGGNVQGLLFPKIFNGGILPTNNVISVSWIFTVTVRMSRAPVGHWLFVRQRTRSRRLSNQAPCCVKVLTPGQSRAGRALTSGRGRSRSPGLLHPWKPGLRNRASLSGQAPGFCIAWRKCVIRNRTLRMGLRISVDEFGFFQIHQILCRLIFSTSVVRLRCSSLAARFLIPFVFSRDCTIRDFSNSVTAEFRQMPSPEILMPEGLNGF